jgi:hypothetical protein
MSDEKDKPLNETALTEDLARAIADDIDKEFQSAASAKPERVEVLDQDENGVVLKVREHYGSGFIFEYRTPEGIERGFPEESEQFTPEIGQYAFSGSPWGEWSMSRRVYRFMRDLGEKLADSFGRAPTGNTGEHFENEVFSMRAYCWCDGDRHPDGCPPNFKCGDFEVRWYKYLGRGSSMNRNIGAEELAEIERRCMESLG